MDDVTMENTLRQYVQTVSKRLMPKLLQLKDPQEKIGFVLSQPETLELEQTLEEFLVAASESFPRKNLELSRRNREDGNAAFCAGNHDLALLLYSEALRYAPAQEDHADHAQAAPENEFAAAAANRSATLYHLNRYEECLQDIELALSAGYPSSCAYKLYIRQCKCLLLLGRVRAAQASFDSAVDAIDRSGLNRDLRKGMVAELQEAFINLINTEEEKAAVVKEEPREEGRASAPCPSVPPWLRLRHPHPAYPSASSAITVRYDDSIGRHAVAARAVDAGEILFVEEPAVACLDQDEDADVDACAECFVLLDAASAFVPCASCAGVAFCSVTCRNRAFQSHHKVECSAFPILKASGLVHMPLALLALRAVTQKTPKFFMDNRTKFESHNVRTGGVEEELHDGKVYLSEDYENLFNLVTHEEKREPIDLTTKAIFAVFLMCCIKSAGYFKDYVGEAAEPLIARLLLHFLQCFQFNTHMVECIFSNRVVASADAETRVWRNKAHQLDPAREFVETTRLGAGVFPTLACAVNHSCDPNVCVTNFGKAAVVVATRCIGEGEQVCDTYGAVFYQMDRKDRREFLQRSHWFDCGCPACTHHWPQFQRLPREYLKLPGRHFRYRRCNRKELQKDVERIRVDIKKALAQEDPCTEGGFRKDSGLEKARGSFSRWGTLLSELLLPPHTDFVQVRRGIRSCLWLQSPNQVRAKEDDDLREKKAKFKEAKR